MRWALIQCDGRSTGLGNLIADILIKRTSKTQGEDSHLQAKDRGLQRNQACGHLGLRLPTSRAVRQQTSTVEDPILGHIAMAALTN